MSDNDYSKEDAAREVAENIAESFLPDSAKMTVPAGVNPVYDHSKQAWIVPATIELSDLIVSSYYTHYCD